MIRLQQASSLSSRRSHVSSSSAIQSATPATTARYFQ
nr:MAG TPA: hypothetical protein [Caudoviricetes sp.]